MSHGDCSLTTVKQVSCPYNKLWSTGFTPYSRVGIDQHFGGTCCRLFQVQLGYIGRLQGILLTATGVGERAGSNGG
jgi:hypothetical protein